MARRATLIDSLRALDLELIVVDAGEYVDTDSPSPEEKSAFVRRELVSMGYDAVGVSANDLDVIRDFSGEPSTLLSNPGSAAPVGVSEMKILDSAGVRVGLFALADAPTMGDPVVAAERVLGEMKAEGVELVVLLSQLAAGTADSLLTKFGDDIDLVVMAHPSTRRASPVTPPGAARAYVHPKGRAVIVVDVTLTDDGTTEVVQEKVLLGKSIPADPHVQVRVDAMTEREAAASRAKREARR